MVKLGPDLYSGTDAYSGYLANGNFTGFTMLHESGTGGAPKYGVVSQMPVVGTVNNPLSDAINDTRAAPDYTEIGYYKASLGSGTVLEMAATNKAGMFQYTFPSVNKDLNVLVDVSHVLSSYRGQGLEQHFLGGSINVEEDTDAGHYYYTGSGTYNNVSHDPAYPFFGNLKSTKMNFRDGTELVLGQSISVDISTPQLLSKHLLERA